jgi:PAS domain S-box-containing protein
MLTKNTENNRILIIDDHKPIHDDFKDILSNQNPINDISELEIKMFGDSTKQLEFPDYELISAHQGEEGLGIVKQSLIDKKPISLAFVDVRMPPGWDGIKTIHKLWEVDPAIQIVICTAYSDYSWFDIQREFGQIDSLVFMRKPFDSIEVRQLASTLVKKWNLAKQAEMKQEELERLVRERTEELSIATRRYYTILQYAGIPIFLADLEGRIENVNATVYDYFGYQDDEVEGKHISSFLHNENNDSLSWSDPVHNLETLGWRKDGSHFNASVTSARVEIPGGEALTVFATDISETITREQRDKELIIHKQESRRWASLAVLGGGIAHDFNNLMMVIVGNAELALMDISDEKRLEIYLNEIIEKTEEAADLTSKLLVYSGKGNNFPTDLDITNVILEQRKDHAASIHKECNLVLDFEEDLPTVHMDKGLLGQLLSCIFVNAVEAVEEAKKEDGIVTVRTGRESLGFEEIAKLNADEYAKPGKYIFYEVIDNGVGMSGEVLSRAFEPFYSTKFTGRGLGLPAVIGILRTINGVISINSKPGTGTRVKVYLPLIKRTKSTDTLH